MKSQRIYESPYGSPNIPTDVSLSQFLSKVNPDDAPGDKTIISDFHDAKHTLTFSGLREQAACCATGLGNLLNLKEGDVVCLWGLNSVNWFLLAHSVMWAGGVFAGINATATSYELVHYFEISQPTIIAVDAAMVGRVEEALGMSKGLKQIPKILLIDDGTQTSSRKERVFPRDIIHFTSACALPFDISARDNRRVAAAMCFSSGTSGKPKGVLLSHYALIGYCVTNRMTCPLITNYYQIEVFFPPFCHIYGIFVALLLPAFTGQHVVAMPKFEFVPFLKKCVEVRATIARILPSIAIQMAKNPAVQGLDLTSINVLFSAGASLPNEVAEELTRKLKGVTVLNGFGMSEGCITSLPMSWSTKKPGSIGKPQAGVSIRIVNDNYEDVEPGQEGECLFKGSTVLMRYINNEAATKEAFRDGWLCTGDVLKVDEDGFMWLTGRKKELIKYKGNQIAPAELEEVLLGHPMVNEAGVCATWDERRETEVPVGYVNFTQSVELGKRGSVLTEIKEFLEGRVAPHKSLRGGLFYLDELPKGPTGKLQRRDLPAAKKERRQAKL